MRERIIALSVMYKGEWGKIAEGLQHHDRLPVIRMDMPCVTYGEPEYPPIFYQLRYPPWILYYRGDLKLTEQLTTGIVGSRNACRYALGMTERCCRVLNNEVIVSGLARGIDGAAHRSALRYSLGTVGVAGCGLDVCYPRENANLYRQLARSQLLLSEYPPGCAPLKHHFPWRNRLIAVLSQRILVMQAGYHSGTMCTVNEALELGREIFCLPYPAMDPEGEGCNLLISQGAEILQDPQELKRKKK